MTGNAGSDESRAIERLELAAMEVARSVLRGRGTGNSFLLLDPFEGGGSGKNAGRVKGRTLRIPLFPPEPGSKRGLDKFVMWGYIRFDPFMKPLSRLCRLTILGNDPMVEGDISSLLLIRSAGGKGTSGRGQNKLEIFL